MAAKDDFHIETLNSGTGGAFKDLIKIYEDAIPLEERKSPAALMDMTRREDYRVFVGICDGVLVCFAVLFRFSKSNECLLEYMAVDKARRDSGFGSRLFQHVAASDFAAGRYLIMEVDSDKNEESQASQASRRKRFYRALGCRELEGLAYLMPKVGSRRPPHMELLVYKSGLPKSIDKSMLGQWLACIYTEIYQQSAEDPRIEKMLSLLPDSVHLI